MRDRKPPKVSVIVAVHNAESTIKDCINAILHSTYKPFELIAVDDCCTDRSLEILKQLPVTVLSLHKNSGPATARNRGAEAASGEWLLFLDSDVVIFPETIEKIVRWFQNDAELVAVQGNYTASSGNDNLMTRYVDYLTEYKTKNLKAEYVNVAKSYCFAITRQTFQAVGGFDHLIRRATVEDNDLGARLDRAGYKIKEIKELQVLHLKRYSLSSQLRRSFYTNSDRIKLILRTRRLGHSPGNAEHIPMVLTDKVTMFKFQIGGLLTLIMAMHLILSILSPEMLYWVLASLALFVFLNAPFIAALRNKTSGWFTIWWLSVFIMDLFISGLGSVHGLFEFYILRRTY